MFEIVDGRRTDYGRTLEHYYMYKLTYEPLAQLKKHAMASLGENFFGLFSYQFGLKLF